MEKLRRFLLLGGCLLFFSSSAMALTANKVWYEFHPYFFRVYIQYTIPELREFREAVIDLRSKKEAEQFYWSLVRGAEFYLTTNKLIFIPNPNRPTPW